MPVGVVMFNNGRQHAPVQPGMPGMPPSYIEATIKPVAYPPPYYSIGKFVSSCGHCVFAC